MCFTFFHLVFLFFLGGSLKQQTKDLKPTPKQLYNAKRVIYVQREGDGGRCLYGKSGEHQTYHTAPQKLHSNFKQATILVFCNVNVRTPIPSASSHGDDDWGV